MEGPLFRLDRLDGPPSQRAVERYDRPFLALPVTGEVVVDGEKIAAGECALVPDWSSLVVVAGSKILITQPLST